MAKNGGKRDGAGRKKGTKNKLTQASVALAEELGVDPLRVVLTAIQNAITNNDEKTAVQYSQIALPYTSPKLSQIEATTTVEANIRTGIDTAKDIAAAVWPSNRHPRRIPEE